ncbi:hypothetical protein GQ44DRAFT_762436 [Phaeosphaeriaceae sp. PMI808]|nr:hypothetical protein GQ44DRAFT_762436 [Phaeosphaeriaceae sp. PMI808]
MAAQHPQPPNSGVSRQYHFWTQGTTTYFKINDLNHGIINDIPGAQYERPITNLWAAICRVYFQNTTIIPGGPVWAIDIQIISKSTDDMGARIPDIVKVKPISARPTTQEREYLWVECNKAALDTPCGWKDALEEAAIRLNAAHASHDIFLIIAIGTKCMLLVWNPLNTIQQPQLSIQSNQAGMEGAPPPIWQADPRVKFIQGARWADQLTGRVDTSQAYKLGCSTMTPVDLPGGDQEQVLACGNEMGLIEAYLVGISNMVVGDNGPQDLA